MASKDAFKKEYVKAIMDGNAAAFVGAGFSRPSGFVDWKGLLRPFAEEIGINIDDEPDLTCVAQYVVNKAGNRGTINSLILDAFSKDARKNTNVDILTRLPIYTYWTTNYDQLIENGLRNANKNVDVKIDYKQLSTIKRDRDAVVYKMHGDVDHPADAVITKDDYVQYNKKHPFFKSVLQGDLISKTFVFIGFSFEDPNLDSILCQIRLQMDENIRNHYWITKRVARNDSHIKNDEDFGYKKASQDLRAEDLKRYGIQTVYVDDYSEITEILKDIEEAVLANNVFISGSIDVYDTEWPKEKVEKFSYILSNSLVKEEFKITSGFGLGIGSSVINGALDEIYSSKYKHCDEYMCLRPFPQGISDAIERKEKWKKYREEILDENGVSIFIFGNKRNKAGDKALADGCLQEFEIAKQKNCVIIPIGSTGDAAEKIYEEVRKDLDKYPYLKKDIDALGTEKDIEKLVQIVIEILKNRRIA